MTDPTRSPRHLLPVLFLGVLMVALDIAIVGPALTAIREDFGVSDRAIAWVFSMFVLFNLVGLPLMARLADVFGRRLVYTVDIWTSASIDIRTSASKAVTEQQILDLEREAFCSLVGEKKSLERMQYMLMNNKPLRN